MSTIQQIIENSNTSMLAAVETAMEVRLSQIKRELIMQLSNKYQFDADEALELVAGPLIEVPSKLKKKKKKKKKDPKAPGGPKNMFICFSQAKRPDLILQYTDMKTTDITKQLGVLWKNLDDAERLPYKTLAADDKERYRNEMILYESANNEN